MLLLSYSDEDDTRKCDARCYDACAGICKCICGGMNHGVGVEQAISNVQELFSISRDDLENDGMEIDARDVNEILKLQGKPPMFHSPDPEDDEMLED